MSLHMNVRDILVKSYIPMTNICTTLISLSTYVICFNKRLKFLHFFPSKFMSLNIYFEFFLLPK